jgi:hypothetical protein
LRANDRILSTLAKEIWHIRPSLRAPHPILRRHAKENYTDELSLRRSRRRLRQSPTVRTEIFVHFLRRSKVEAKPKSRFIGMAISNCSHSTVLHLLGRTEAKPAPEARQPPILRDQDIPIAFPLVIPAHAPNPLASKSVSIRVNQCQKEMSSGFRQGCEDIQSPALTGH